MASKQLELALRIAAKVSGREDLAGLADTVRDVGKEADDATPSAKDLGNELEKLGQQKAQIDAFNDSRRALLEFEQQTAEMAGSLDALQRELRDTATPTDALRQEVADAERALDSQRIALQMQASAHNALQAELKQSGIATDQVRVAEKQVKEQISATTKELEKQGKEAAGTAGKNKTFSESVSGMTTRLLALAGTYFGVRTLWDGLKGILSTGDQFERLDKQLAAVMGSIEGGEQAAAWIKEFAKDTPLELEQVTQVFTKLKAFGIDPMNGSMQAVVDQAYKLGGSFETVEGISLALGQAWAKQKLQGEEILQLVERGVPVWDMLAKATGKNTLELQALSSAGKLGRAEIQLLMDEIAASSQGAAQSQMSTLSGLISNLKDTWAGFLNDIASSGVLDYFKGQLQALSAEISRMAASGELRAMAQRISDGIVTAAQAVKGFITTLWDLRGTIQMIATVAGGVKLLQIFTGVASETGLVRRSLAQLVAVLKDGAGGARSFAEAIWESLITAFAEASSGAGALSTMLLNVFLVSVAAATYQLAKLPGAVAGWVSSSRAAGAAAEAAAAQMDINTAALADINAQLGLNLNSLSELYDMEERGLVIYDQATGTWQKVSEAKLAEAEATQRAADAAKAQQEAIAALTSAYGNAITEGKSAAEAVAAVFEAANLNTTAGIVDLQRVLGELAASAFDGGEQIRAGIRKQLQELTTDDLRAFSAAARVSMGEFAGATDAAAAANVEAFRRLGVDIDLATNKITDTGKAALDTFNLIAGEAGNSGEKIKLAFDGALAQMRNSTEVDALRAKVVALGEQGRLTGDQLAQMLAELERRSTDVIPGIQSVEEAFKALGITSERELKRAADAAKEAFEVIKAEGTLAEQKAAFEAYAKTAIAANQGVADSTLQAQAAALGMSDELGKLGDKGQTAAAQLADMPQILGAIKASSDETQAALASVRDSIDQVVANTDQGTQAVSNAMASAAENVRQEVASLSDSALAMFQQMAAGTVTISEFRTESDALRAKLAEVGDQLWHLNDDVMNALGGLSIGSYFLDIKNALLQTQKAYYEQRLEVEKLIDTYNDAGGATAQWLRQAEGLVPQLELLNDTDLSAIRSNIDAARRAMEQLRDSGEDAVASLRSELAELQGDYEAVEQLRAAQRKAELQAKLDEAKTFGDREAIARYQEALDLLERVNAIKASEARERTETNKPRSSNSSGTTTTTTTSSNSGSGRFVLELAMPGGAVAINTDKSSIDALTRELERLRSVS